MSAQESLGRQFVTRIEEIPDGTMLTKWDVTGGKRQWIGQLAWAGNNYPHHMRPEVGPGEVVGAGVEKDYREQGHAKELYRLAQGLHSVWPTRFTKPVLPE